MKLFIVLSLAALTACEETYSTENDNIDVEAVVSDDNTLKAFYGCFMGTSSCNAVMGDFKKDLPEVFQTACAKCTADQKHILKRFLETLKVKFPKDLEELKKKYDPEGINFVKLETAIANA